MLGRGTLRLSSPRPPVPSGGHRVSPSWVLPRGDAGTKVLHPRRGLSGRGAPPTRSPVSLTTVSPARQLSGPLRSFLSKFSWHRNPGTKIQTRMKETAAQSPGLETHSCAEAIGAPAGENPGASSVCGRWPPWERCGPRAGVSQVRQGWPWQRRPTAPRSVTHTEMRQASPPWTRGKVSLHVQVTPLPRGPTAGGTREALAASRARS